MGPICTGGVSQPCCRTVTIHLGIRVDQAKPRVEVEQRWQLWKGVQHGVTGNELFQPRKKARGVKWLKTSSTIGSLRLYRGADIKGGRSGLPRRDSAF
jgi:hypothetical protein